MPSETPERDARAGKRMRRDQEPRPPSRGRRERPSTAPAPKLATARAPAPALPPATPRRPQQERGQRRVDAILDAAAALITEEGIAGVTMHRVARLSATTIGSMYHFFPDRDALLHALVERHVLALREITARIGRDTAPQWAQLSTADAVGRFLDPFLAYTDEHPDLPALARFVRTMGGAADRDAELDRLVIQLAETLIASRSPNATPSELTIRAITMTSMVEGVVGAAARGGAPARSALSDAAVRAELRRALVAYLDSYAEPRRRSSARR